MNRPTTAKSAPDLVKPPDGWLLGIVLLLVIGGCWLVFDSSYSYASDTYGDVYYMLKKHLIFACVGVIGMLGISYLPLKFIRQISKPLLFTGFMLMFGVLLPGIGHKVNGAQSWYRFAGISIQPSEIMKVVLVIYLASALTNGRVFIKGADPKRWQIPALISFLAIGFTVAQKDFGTASILTAVALITFFAAGARKAAIIQIIVALVLIPVLVFSTGLKKAGPLEHINVRIAAFQDPWQFPFDEGYQTIHSLTALGTGGLIGRGPCQGREKMLLPAAWTDYIAATLGEEAGLVGILMLLGGFVIFTYRGMEIARKARHDFGTVMAVGLTSIVSMQAMINLAVVSSAMPATGVPLPFISYGGSALVCMLWGVGLILAVSHRPNEELKDYVADESRIVRRGNRRAHLPRHQRRSNNPSPSARRRSPVYR